LVINLMTLITLIFWCFTFYFLLIFNLNKLLFLLLYSQNNLFQSKYFLISRISKRMIFFNNL
jgi:hypothetical protein